MDDDGFNSIFFVLRLFAAINCRSVLSVLKSSNGGPQILQHVGPRRNALSYERTLLPSDGRTDGYKRAGGKWAQGETKQHRYPVHF